MDFRTATLKELGKPEKDLLLKAKTEMRAQRREIFVRIVPTLCMPDLMNSFEPSSRSGNAHYASSQRTIHAADLTEEAFVSDLKGSKTEQNLRTAFASETQANRRYIYFAKHGDVEGYPEIAGMFRDTAEGETNHAQGHLDHLKKIRDPARGVRSETRSGVLKLQLRGNE